MTGPMVYMAEPNVRVFDFRTASGWVVIPGPKCYTAEAKYDRVIKNIRKDSHRRHCLM
jgi:hypothetical protein